MDRQMNHLELFNQHQSLLFAIAYRMLGSITSVEKLEQEAWVVIRNCGVSYFPIPVLTISGH
jgi:DNA-directed RNA polymerase specialized sigma24 family protein